MEGRYFKSCNFSITIDTGDEDDNEVLLFVDEVNFAAEEDKLLLDIYINASEDVNIFRYLRTLQISKSRVPIVVKAMSPEFKSGFVITDGLYALKGYSCHLCMNDSGVLSIYTRWEG